MGLLQLLTIYCSILDFVNNRHADGSKVYVIDDQIRDKGPFTIIGDYIEDPETNEISYLVKCGDVTRIYLESQLVTQNQMILMRSGKD